MSREPTSADVEVSTDGTTDRRANSELRRLIDEMLERVREMNRKVGVWGAEERMRAETDLESIMARVRRAASKRGEAGR